ncbi:MAG: sterol desaturase family protein, partial [Steroidobacteraceae bacterium]|nr:sterol desaturase family protein [Steroidobacteraceae bacterium]MDW8258627.1 sterol desaturase family protein [Gammaproteobacteria bacterium]
MALSLPSWLLIVPLAWLALSLVGERWLAARRPPEGRWRGRLLNLGLAGINFVGLRLALPAGLATVAARFGDAIWGGPLLPSWLTWLMLDLGLYLQHRAMHRWQWAWRMHAAHHADTHIDATTGLRFHPLEIAASTLWKSVLIVALGAPVPVVIGFEFVLLIG